MNNWKKCKLGDICSKITDGSHKSPPSQTSGFPMASVKDMEYNQINLNTCRKISKEDYLELVASGCQPEINDILIAKDGSYLKHVFRVRKKEELVLLSSIAIIRPILEQVCPQFLIYVFKNKRFIEEIESNYVTGAVIPRIVLRDFKEIEITLPPLEEQRQIAAILSSIDDKIELLHEQNKTLEELAQTLFRHYFIENSNPSWQNVKLGDLVEVVDNRGKTPPLSNENTIYPVVEVNSLNGESRVINYSVVRKYIDKETYDTWFRAGHPKKYDVLISTVGSIGELAMFLDDIGSIAQNVVALRASSDYKCYLYEALKFMKNDLKELDIGSVQPSIKIPHLLSLAILKPNGLILQKFNDEVLKFIDKISSNVKQIQTLENMRDILIPKLLNGEIKVGGNQ